MLAMLPALLEQLRHDAGPARLVTGPDASAVVAVEIFIKKRIVFPIGICLKLRLAAKNRASSLRILQKGAREPVREIHGHFPQSFHLSGPFRTFHFEVIA